MALCTLQHCKGVVAWECAPCSPEGEGNAALAAAVPVCCSVQRLRTPSGREGAQLGHVGGCVGDQHQIHPGCHSSRGLPIEQAPVRQVGGDQGGRASSVHANARPCSASRPLVSLYIGIRCSLVHWEDKLAHRVRQQIRCLPLAMDHGP